MLDYKLKIYERRCFAVFTEKMLELMKRKHNDDNLELRIIPDTSYPFNPLDICIHDDKGERRYDEEDMIECISDEVGVEINNMFFDGDEFGGLLYFTEQRYE